jgi:hypothetical protein
VVVGGAELGVEVWVVVVGGGMCELMLPRNLWTTTTTTTTSDDLVFAPRDLKS